MDEVRGMMGGVDFPGRLRWWLAAGCGVAVPWFLVCPCTAAEMDAGWGKERVEVVSSTRGRVCLNGMWRFSPGGEGGALTEAEGAWGWIRVPGFWSVSNGAPGIGVRGSGAAWENFGDGVGCSVGWYERRVAVPEAWAGRTIVLDCTRLEGDAQVLIDGREAGRIGWPGGELDVTPMAKAGGEVTLRLRVERLVGGGAHGGIGGDVILSCRPKGRHIAGVIASSSIESGEVSLRVVLAGAGKAGDATVSAVFSGAETTRRFGASVQAPQEDGGSLQCSWRWPGAPVWDLGAPRLLSLKVAVEGPGVRDEWAGPFGFREFRLEGRWLRMNGSRVRLVPAPSPGGGTPEAIEAELRRLYGLGFNAVVCDAAGWGRGCGAPDAAWLCEAAARAGLVVVAPLAGLSVVLDRWSGQRGEAVWRQEVVRELGRLGAWPSVVAWSADDGGLAFSGGAHPARLGIRAWPSSERWRDRARMAGFAVEAIRRVDPWRPVMLCGGGPLGEIDAPRAMVGWAPVQEVEDWPSRWVETGEMPFVTLDSWAASGAGLFAVGREWLGPLVVEHAAAELGPAAYGREDMTLRKAIADGPMAWRPEVVGGGPLVEELGARFMGRVGRAWRGWGVAALPVAPGPALRTLAATAEGGQGEVRPGLRGWLVSAGRGGSGVWPWPVDASWAGPTLGWIAGPPENFTSKDHHYLAGARVEKSIVVVNDGRAEAGYSVRWHADVAGQEVGFGEHKGHLAAGQARFLPVDFACPLVNLKAEGKIRLEGELGGRSIENDFAVRVYPGVPGAEAGRAVHVFDPSGETSRVLRALGFKVQSWDGKGEANRVLIIGRGALSAGPSAPGSFEQFAADGGRVLICAQERGWVRSGTAFRPNLRAERACWEVGTQRSHPLVRGLDAEDLRDWSGGHGPRPGLAAPDPGATLRIAALFPPAWGDRGTVTVAAPEKPHFGGWHPIIECGFDLSYAPLMELEHGRGVILWCSMEADSRAENDPVARDLLMRMIGYLEGFRPAPERGPTYYTGGEIWRTRLEAMGVDFQPVQAMPKVPGLLVVADDSPIVDRLIEEHLERGGSALFLPRERERLPMGFMAKPGSFYGRPEGLPPWPECRGLSVSDVRTRCDIRAPLIVSGPGKVAAGGLMARLQRGSGTALFVQVGPDQIASGGSAALGLSECRNLGLLSRLLANMGATFATDRRAFAPQADPLLPALLEGGWMVRMEPGKPRELAEGSFGESAGWAEADAEMREWKAVRLPGSWQDADPALAVFHGAVWVRREVNLLKEWADRPLLLKLGQWRGSVVVYFNGKRLGAGAVGDGGALVVSVPPGLAVEGTNVIAVRVWDEGGLAGLFSRDGESLRLEVAGRPSGRGYYQTGRDGKPLTSDRLSWLPDMDSNHD
ncbi:MAG TPA: hypothetical protein PLU30_14285 [Verrucomicrobiae bacterium]|nr:hypothetical protein [Verrucomicrobiae bacterium]